MDNAQQVSRNDMIHVNSYFVDEYFKDLMHNIRHYDRKKNTKEKDILCNIEPPNFCCCKYKDINILTDFANKLKSKMDKIPNEDICIAVLMAFYSISLLEHDEFISYKIIIDKAKYPSLTLKLYYGICGVNVVTKSMNLFDKNIVRLDYNCDIFQDIRSYMVLGILRKDQEKEKQKQNNCEKTCCAHQ